MNRILFVSKGEAASSTRYRALQFFDLWTAAGYAPTHVTASGGLLATVRMLLLARQADVVIVLRKTFPLPLLRLLRLVAHRLVFDFDDAIFCNTDGTPSTTRMARFAAMIRCCDHILAGNRFLAESATRFNRAVTVAPTCLDVARYRATFTKPLDFIDLVWIGSASTRKYLLDALPWIEAAFTRVPALRLKIIADFDLPDSRIPVLSVRWCADAEARELASAHIGIAPLRDDDWSRGKCALKVLQYMAANLPVISAHAGANAEVVSDGLTGFLAATPSKWAECIVLLAENPQLRSRMGEVGRQHVETIYARERVFGIIHDAIRQLA